MARIKRIDTSIAERVKIIKTRREPEFEMKKVEVWEYEDMMFKVGTILFPLQDTGNRFGIENGDILILLYLHNLIVFNREVSVMDNVISTTRLKNYGYVVEDFSSSSVTLYRLSGKGIEIVEYFYRSLKNSEKNIAKNKAMEIDARASVKSALNSYFQT